MKKWCHFQQKQRISNMNCVPLVPKQSENKEHCELNVLDVTHFYQCQQHLSCVFVIWLLPAGFQTCMKLCASLWISIRKERRNSSPPKPHCAGNMTTTMATTPKLRGEIRISECQGLSFMSESSTQITSAQSFTLKTVCMCVCVLCWRPDTQHLPDPPEPEPAHSNASTRSDQETLASMKPPIIFAPSAIER